jgi:hypothetical protein
MRVNFMNRLLEHIRFSPKGPNREPFSNSNKPFGSAVVGFITTLPGPFRQDSFAVPVLAFGVRKSEHISMLGFHDAVLRGYCSADGWCSQDPFPAGRRRSVSEIYFAYQVVPAGVSLRKMP